ncbi:hypothetical protein PPRFG01_0058600 [Plasmodium sp.]|nr:hypothetical protein PPRFG01_0058600 [Plasmodium sp.]
MWCFYLKPSVQKKTVHLNVVVTKHTLHGEVQLGASYILVQLGAIYTLVQLSASYTLVQLSASYTLVQVGAFYKNFRI